MALFTKTVFMSLLAIIVGLVSTMLVFFTILHKTYLTQSGPYSSWERSAYAAVSTIVASAATAFVTSQMRCLWVRQVNHELHSNRRLFRHTSLDSKWRVVLSVGSPVEMIRNMKVQITLLVTALITTSLVTSFTPTLSIRSTDEYSVVISSGQLYTRECCYNAQQVYANVSCIGLSSLWWNTSDGRQVWMNPAGGTCPNRQGLTLIKQINALTPQDYAYRDQGVYVSSTALGTPIAAYGSVPGYAQDLQRLIQKFGNDLVNTTQCVPVMVRNPATCRKGGSINLKQVQNITSFLATSDDGRCSVANYVPNLNYTIHYMMAKGLCPSEEIGQAKVVVAGTGGYAGWVALSVGDEDYYNQVTNRNTGGLDGYLGPGTNTDYVVTCDIDARDVYAFREVALSFVRDQNSSPGLMLRGISSSDCKPAVAWPPDMQGVVTAAATAMWQPLLEFQGLDGWWDSINSASQDFSHAPTVHARTTFAFPESHNGLEDVIGVTAAMVGAYMNSSIITIPAAATFTTTRIGAGHAWGLVFAIPPFLASCILMIQTYRLLFALDDKCRSGDMKEIVKLQPVPPDGSELDVAVDSSERVSQHSNLLDQRKTFN